MNITFRQGSETLSAKLIDQAEVKITKLSRFMNERNYEAQVYVDVERESGSQKSENLWRTSINVDLGGERFNAIAMGDTPEKAVNMAIKEMKREIRRAGAKQESVRRRGAGLLKQLRQRVV